jgi:aryl-alcohol dehydrogenase-like predicted oxidoreductase
MLSWHLRRCQDLTEAVRHNVTLVTNQLPYSLLMRQIETAGIVEACQRHQAGILCYSPLSQGGSCGRCTLRLASPAANLWVLPGGQAC